MTPSLMELREKLFKSCKALQLCDENTGTELVDVALSAVQQAAANVANKCREE